MQVQDIGRRLEEAAGAGELIVGNICRRVLFIIRDEYATGTRFTCFTGTKGQILTSTKVQVLTPEDLRQWYKAASMLTYADVC